jgi:hypothetical protein
MFEHLRAVAGVLVVPCMSALVAGVRTVPWSFQTPSVLGPLPEAALGCGGPLVRGVSGVASIVGVGLRARLGPGRVVVIVVHEASASGGWTFYRV